MVTYSYIKYISINLPVLFHCIVYFILYDNAVLIIIKNKIYMTILVSKFLFDDLST